MFVLFEGPNPTPFGIGLGWALGFMGSAEVQTWLIQNCGESLGFCPDELFYFDGASVLAHEILLGLREFQKRGA